MRLLFVEDEKEWNRRFVRYCGLKKVLTAELYSLKEYPKEGLKEAYALSRQLRNSVF